MLSERARKRLREIAEETVRAAAERRPLPLDPPDDEPDLLLSRGAFVTLRERGRLRGCIGTIHAAAPLWEAVRDMAVAAARRDPRFEPVQPEEVGGLTVEISVLTALERVGDPESIEVGRDGLYVTRGIDAGLLLPQVATEQGWDRETFLENACLKAGLPPDAWRDPETTIRTFRAEVF